MSLFLFNTKFSSRANDFYKTKWKHITQSWLMYPHFCSLVFSMFVCCFCCCCCCFFQEIFRSQILYIYMYICILCLFVQRDCGTIIFTRSNTQIVIAFHIFLISCQKHTPFCTLFPFQANAFRWQVGFVDTSLSAEGKRRKKFSHQLQKRK